MSGRPREYDRDAIKEAFRAYIEEAPIPILAKFCAKQGFPKSYLYDWAKDDQELDILVKLCVTKKEGALEDGCLNGELNPAMSIFSLKQMGWTDKQENTLKGDPEAPIVISKAGMGW